MRVINYQSHGATTRKQSIHELNLKYALDKLFEAGPSTESRGIGPGGNVHGMRLVGRLPPPEGSQRSCITTSLLFGGRGQHAVFQHVGRPSVA